MHQLTMRYWDYSLNVTDFKEGKMVGIFCERHSASLLFMYFGGCAVACVRACVVFIVVLFFFFFFFFWGGGGG